MKEWKIHHYVRGAYEIAREGEYASGVICVVYKKEEAEYLVAALNFYDYWMKKPECPGPFNEYELWNMDQEIIGYPFIPYRYLKIV